MATTGAKLAALEAVGHAIASPDPVDSLLELVTDELLKAIPAEGVTFFLTEPPDGSLRFVVTRGSAGEKLKAKRIAADEGIVGWVVQHGEYAVVPDVAADRRFSDRMDRHTGFQTRSLLCVPLRTRHGVVGAIELVNPAQDQLTERDAEYVTSIANQAAQLIENVRLFQDRQHHLSMLKALQTASKWLNSSLRIQTVLEYIVKTADEVIKAEAGSIMLVREDGGLDLAVALGPAAEKLMENKELIGKRLEQGIVGWVAKTGKPELIPDCSRDPRFAEGPGPEIRDKLGFETRSIICAPMRTRGDTIGVIELINRVDGEPFDVTDLSALSVFADDAAAALSNARLYQSLEKAYLHTIDSLATALDLRDNETGGHSQRVALFAQEVARRLGMSPEGAADVHQGSLLHDIGKIGIPDQILLKPGKLTDDEWTIMRRHIIIGYRVLEDIDFLRKPAMIPLFHHERYDGNGYLAKLKGEDIPLGARIFAVIDTYDAMTSDRPYRKALPEEVARQEIKEAGGSQLDPRVAEAFLSIPETTIKSIRDSVREQQPTSTSRRATDWEEGEGAKIACQAFRELRDSDLL